MPERTFRIFVSSTFSDFHAERAALQSVVFPRLQKLCLKHGCRFQAIDLRWGVSEEAALDQRAMEICFEELDRCRRLSPRPNFIVLLGDRYGWRPLPSLVPEDEFVAIQQVSSADEQRLLCEWYKRDDNVVIARDQKTCAGYILRPRQDEYRDHERWRAVERQLLKILIAATRAMTLAAADLLKYGTSATEQEIHRGALAIPDAREHVFCFLRTIRNLDALEAAAPARGARDSADFDARGQLDAPSPHQLLLDLRSRLQKTLGDNVTDFSASWTGEYLTEAHLMPLCAAVYKRLKGIILKEIAAVADPCVDEDAAHLQFERDRDTTFIGRGSVLDRVRAYLHGQEPHPLVVIAPPGLGKTALMARSAAIARAELPAASIVERFVGATSRASDGFSLLHGLHEAIGGGTAPDETASADYGLLVHQLLRDLSPVPPARPVAVFVDGVDHLPGDDPARDLAWLPSSLPGSVRLLVSIADDALPVGLADRLPPGALVRLDPLNADEGATLLDTWLDGASRTLQRAQKEALLSRFAANGSPLLLRLMFEDARRWPSFRAVSEAGLPADAASAIDSLLQRLRDGHGPVLIERLFAYLAASRQGLSEDELVRLLTDDEILAEARKRSPLSPVTPGLATVVWARVLSDLRPYLSERRIGGLLILGFQDRLVKDAARRDCLAPQVAPERHERLAAFFLEALPAALDSDAGDVHALVELPVHLARSDRAGRLDELHAIFRDVRYLERRCSRASVYELVRDYQVASAGGDSQLTSLRDLLVAHTQSLARLPHLAFGLVWREGTPELRQAIEAASARGDRSWPWIRATDVTISGATAREDVLAPRASLEYPASVVTAMAAGRGIAFHFSRLGQLQVLELGHAEPSPTPLLVRRLRPIALCVSFAGDRLAIAFENGEADVMDIAYDPRRGGPVSVRTVHSLRFRMPDTEAPVLAFAGSDLWYQEAGDGAIVRLAFQDGQVHAERSPVPAEPEATELSGIAVTKDAVVFSLRQGREAILWALAGGRMVGPVSLGQTDVTALCEASTGVAVGLSDRRVEVFDLPGLGRRSGTVARNAPLALWSRGDLLSWCTVEGFHERWAPTSTSMPGTINGPFLIRPQIACTDDGEVSIVSARLAGCFVLSSGAPAPAGTIVGLFTDADREELAVLRASDSGLQLARGASQDLQIVPPEAQPGGDLAAMDGQSRILVLHHQREAHWVAPGAAPVRIAASFPGWCTSIAGAPEGGFWIAMEIGDLLFLDEDQQLRKMYGLDDPRIAQPRVWAWRGLVLLMASRPTPPSFVDRTPAISLFEPSMSKPIPELRLMGTRHFGPEDGIVSAVAFHPDRRRLVSFMSRGTGMPQYVRCGSPEDFTRHAEKTRALDPLLANANAARFSADGTGLYVIAKGHLFFVDGTTFQIRASLCGKARFTSMVDGAPPADGATVVVEDDTRVIRCAFEEGTR